MLVIETPERVPLHFALASIGNRFIACPYDSNSDADRGSDSLRDNFRCVQSWVTADECAEVGDCVAHRYSIRDLKRILCGF